MVAPTQTIGVIGLGLIGGSVALESLAEGWSLLATDVDPDQREAAAAAGVAVTDDVEEVARVADLIVVATPAPQVMDVMHRIDRVRVTPVVVTSVASVQGPTTTAARAAELRYVRHLGGHPMTGTERSGFRAARRGMFDGSPWIITADAEDQVGSLRAVVDLALGLGAVPAVLPPDEHDRTVALLSHLPHVLAYAMFSRLQTDDAQGADLLAGGSFRDATRVAATRPSFWAEVLSLNRVAVADLVAGVRDDLAEVEALLRGDAPVPQLEAWLARGHRAVGRPRPATPPPTPVPRDAQAPLGETLARELRDYTRGGLGIEGWVDDGDALSWSPL
ncbi:MAG: prephenate dehydrogenase [Nitriliruptoraceae bacterium]|jgi:prephenate dehydrogenase